MRGKHSYPLSEFERLPDSIREKLSDHVVFERKYFSHKSGTKYYELFSLTPSNSVPDKTSLTVAKYGKEQSGIPTTSKYTRWVSDTPEQCHIEVAKKERDKKNRGYVPNHFLCETHIVMTETGLDELVEAWLPGLDGISDVISCLSLTPPEVFSTGSRSTPQKPEELELAEGWAVWS